jgi:DNA-directed RNA polymerase specialized sigma24 family protein
MKVTRVPATIAIHMPGNLRDESTDELVLSETKQGTQQDSHSTISEIVNNWNWVYSYMHRVLQDPDVASDLAQEALIKMMMRRNSQTPARLLLHGIVKRLLVDYMRENRRSPHEAGRALAAVANVDLSSQDDPSIDPEWLGRSPSDAQSVETAPARRSSDHLRQALEDSLLRRVESTIRAALGRMTIPDLLRAVEAPSPAATVAQIINAAPDVGIDQESAWTRALARGAARKQEMLQRAGGVLSSGQVAELLGITVSAVNQRKNRHRSILAVPLSGGEWGFPARQFADGAVRDGVAEVVREAAAMSPWVLLSILLDDASVEGGTTLLDRLDDPTVRADVLHRVRTYGEHVAA